MYVFPAGNPKSSGYFKVLNNTTYTVINKKKILKI